MECSVLKDKCAGVYLIRQCNSYEPTDDLKVTLSAYIPIVVVHPSVPSVENVVIFLLFRFLWEMALSFVLSVKKCLLAGLSAMIIFDRVEASI